MQIKYKHFAFEKGTQDKLVNINSLKYEWPQWYSADILLHNNKPVVLVRKSATLDYDLIDPFPLILNYFSLSLPNYYWVHYNENELYDFDANVSKILEEIYLDKKPINIIQYNKYQWLVDFEKMEMTNIEDEDHEVIKIDRLCRK